MSREDIETLKNNALTESAATFTKWPAMRLGTVRSRKFAPFDPHSGYEVDTAGEVLENGDVVFRFYAPKAETVTVGLGKYNRRVEIELKKREDGVFEGTFPQDPSFYGFQEVQFYIDGNEALNPHMGVVAGLHRLFNYMELPDPGVPFVLLRDDVPHGSINREVYYSKAVGAWQRCLVYTPPGYQEGGSYPVVYLQDGANGSELTWMYSRKVPYILDNLIAEGKCVPMIAVSSDPMIQKDYEQDAVDNFDGTDQNFQESLIPFIDGRYHTIPDKWHRAIAGFSLGSMQASYMSLVHPELFGNAGILSGYLRRRDTHPRHEDNPYLAQMTEAFMQENYRVFYRCMGDQDGNFPEFLEDDAYVHDLGGDRASCYIRKVYENRIHDINCGRREFYDFAQMLFSN